VSYSKKELLWWHDHPGFEDETWWLLENGVGPQEYKFAADNSLIADKRSDAKKVSYDPGLIFWESLRRHPALQSLLSEIVGLDRFKSGIGREDGFLYSEKEYSEIVLRAKARIDFSKDWHRALFYLVVSHQKCWLNLPFETQTRFRLTIGGLISFLRPDSSNSLVHDNLRLLFHAKEAGDWAPQNEDDSESEADTENSESFGRPWGDALAAPRFIKNVEFEIIHSLSHVWKKEIQSMIRRHR
jgi:hypothetical protein